MEIFEDGTEIPVFTDDANSQKPTLEIERAAAKKFDISNFDFWEGFISLLQYCKIFSYLLQ